MSPERWLRLSELFQEAVEREPAQRAAFVDQACGGDHELRRELESLLSAHLQTDGFLERGPLAEGDIACGAPTLSAGQRLGAYEVISLLAAGGMGEVYRARDLRLEREVALKVLPASALDDASRLRRFHEEARTAGALNHPNILAVHDVGAEGTVPYLVCEMLEGETFQARLLRAGRVPLAEALGWARQVAAGLTAAHEKGIVHRDLKPANLFITTDGRVKVLDFGLAKRTALSGVTAPTAQTRPGFVLGTIGYMSPEQARAEDADARSDVFSFGAVLYEMLCGRPPFAGGSPAESLAALLAAEPDFAALPPDTPPALARVVRRCLQKRPEHRYLSARPLADALDEAARELASGRGAGRRPAVAVLPFRELGADAEAAHLGLALADAAITELAQLRSLLVRPTSAVLRYEGRGADPREAARELGVDAVVDGTVQRSGSRVRVTIQLVDGGDGRALWASKTDGSLDEFFRMQDEVARHVAEALDVELTPGDRRRLGHRQRERLPEGEAYALYLKGRVQLYRESLADCIRAVDWFEKAIAVEPGFALAWTGLAEAYVHIAFEFEPEGDWYVRAEAMCARAMELEPGLPEARYVRARLRWSPRGGFDHAFALRELAAAVAERPNLDGAYVRLGVVLFHIGLIAEAERQLQRALAISPDHVIAQGHLASCRYNAGRFAEALELMAPVAARSRSYWHQYVMAHSLLRLGRLDAAAETALRMHDLGDEGVGHGHAVAALIAALRGDADGARRGAELALSAERAFGHFHHDQYDVACIHALLGETDDALRWLGEAARNGYPCRPFFEADPLLASVRGDARFGALMEEIGAECAGYARLWRELSAGSDAAPAP